MVTVGSLQIVPTFVIVQEGRSGSRLRLITPVGGVVLDVSKYSRSEELCTMYSTACGPSAEGIG